MPHRSLLVLLVAAVSMIPGCGGDSKTTGPGNPPFDEVTLSVGSSQSLGKVYLEGLPAASPGLALQVPDGLEILAQAGEYADRLPVLEDDQGLFFYAPIHPVQPNQGGPLTVRLVQGEDLGPELTLTLEALPPAPGAYALLVSTLRARVEQRAQAYSLSFEDLQAESFETVAQALLPLKVAQEIIDAADPAAVDLTTYVDDTGGLLTPEGRELLDRYCGVAPLQDLVQAEIDAFSGQTGPAPAWGPSGKGPASAPAGCIDRGPDLTTAPQLAEAMTWAKLGDLATAGTQGQILTALGTVLSVGGMLPGIPGAAYSVLGAGVAAWEATAHETAGLYPSRFLSLTFDIDRTTFPEDEPGHATWSNVRVVAASTGWTADADMTNAILSGLGAGASPAQKLIIQGDQVLKEALFTTVDIGLPAALNAYGGVIEFCPRQWSVDITDLPYSTAQALSRRLDVDPATRQVRPLEVGPDVLRVAAQSSQFGGATIQTDLPMVTNQILVHVSPPDAFVTEPGKQEVEITVTLENVDLPTLLWDAGEGSWTDGLQDETNGPGVRRMSTPADPKLYPFEVTVESLSRQGIRAGGLPPRVGIATIRLRKGTITVSPEGICVENGTPRTLAATVTDLADPGVAWTLEEPGTGLPSSDGSISAGGVYTAPPSGSGEVVVVATSTADSTVRGQAEIQFGPCICSWSLSIEGGYSYAGDVAVHHFSAPLPSTISLGHADPEPGNGAVTVVSGLDPGTVGTFDAVFQFSDGTQTWSGQSPSQETSAVLVVNTNTTTSMDGVVSGVALTVIGDQPVYQAYTLWFHSGQTCTP